MHVRYHLATTVLLVFFPSSALMTTAADQKSFAKVASSNGTELCSADPPSSVFQVGGSGSKSCEGLPPSVQCAQLCTQLPNCTNFNYRTDGGQCQLYFYVPSLCTIQPDCTHFQVTQSNISQNRKYKIFFRLAYLNLTLT